MFAIYKVWCHPHYNIGDLLSLQTQWWGALYVHVFSFINFQESTVFKDEVRNTSLPSFYSGCGAGWTSLINLIIKSSTQASNLFLKKELLHCTLVCNLYGVPLEQPNILFLQVMTHLETHAGRGRAQNINTKWRRGQPASFEVLEAQLENRCLAHHDLLYSYNNRVVVGHIGFPNRVEACWHTKDSHSCTCSCRDGESHTFHHSKPPGPSGFLFLVVF